MSGEGEYGLVMPFIAVASKGGPYPDDAYVAGWEAGELWSRLQAAALHRSTPDPVTVRADNAEQIDLIAMRNGFSTEETFRDDETGWVTIRFSPSAGVPE